MNALDELHIETVRRELDARYVLRHSHLSQDCGYCRGVIDSALHFRRLIAEAREREDAVTWTNCVAWRNRE